VSRQSKTLFLLDASLSVTGASAVREAILPVSQNEPVFGLGKYDRRQNA
jgi:hypothetical protein